MNVFKKMFSKPEPVKMPVEETKPVEKSQKWFSKFHELGLSEQSARNLEHLGYHIPTPIQMQAIPSVLLQKDVLACAQTGTGKTAAFSLPVIELLAKSRAQKHPRVLVLTPTRELAIQVHESFVNYGKWSNLKCVLITGGVAEKPQIRMLQEGVDVIIATPGRMINLLNRNFTTIQNIEVLILDEADRMLDMGFLPDVRRVVRLTPKSRQTLLFSATFPTEIEKLSQELLRDPVRVSVARQATPAETVKQLVYLVSQKNKSQLIRYLFKDEALKKVIIFTRTKHGANKLCHVLEHEKIKCAPIHSNKSQNARQKALADFKAGHIRALVASDIAARGLDVDDITHVINYELPEVAETYVHRIGRTGRAGEQGIAFSFCSEEEAPRLVAIERLMKQKVERVTDHPFANAESPAHFQEVAEKPRGPRPQRHPRPQNSQNTQSTQQPNRSPNDKRRNHFGKKPTGL